MTTTRMSRVEVSREARKLYETIVECDGFEVREDDWHLAEELASAGVVYLGGARGPGRSFKRADLVTVPVALPPGEESPAPSPREGVEGSEGEGGSKGAPQWTPGPWGVAGRTVAGAVAVSAGRPGEWRGALAWCDAGNVSRSVDEGHANARLVAAAPDLYEALDELVNGLHSPATYEEAIRKADAALARARGEGS